DLPLSRRNFLEEVPTSKHRSLIAAPMIGSQGESYGILRCINLQEGFRILPGFLPSDLKFFKLVASVLARFIEIAQLASRRRRFMREMAHEFATPLLQAETNTAFLNLILTGRQTTKDPNQVIGSLKGHISHLQALVRNIQYNVRPDADFEASFKFDSPVDLHGLIEQIRKPMLSLARSRAIEIRGKTSQLPNLFVDKDRLAQVFYNLLYNAVKYSPHGSKDIWIAHDVIDENVGGHQSAKWHRISVSNYGIGIPKGEEERIFEEYVRGSNTQYIRQGQSGSGLGLTISRRIVERHGGILRLERLDNPTVFSVLLPAALEEGGPLL
ncbi:MAG TPA: HAMP domain-containing sensor histidine kinase, partial [Thermoanaerobaculia bacterium]|nr:HAMP domain-containing sensor histidine kinase [Thermoanaerobaculia bacterium]